MSKLRSWELRKPKLSGRFLDLFCWFRIVFFFFNVFWKVVCINFVAVKWWFGTSWGYWFGLVERERENRAPAVCGSWVVFFFFLENLELLFAYSEGLILISFWIRDEDFGSGFKQLELVLVEGSSALYSSTRWAAAAVSDRERCSVLGSPLAVLLVWL